MLHNLQNDFIDHLFDRSSDVVPHVTTEGGFSPEQRMQVYKNNTRLILTDILLQSFPAVTRLVDEKFIHYAAHEFIKTQPPVSGDMNDYGATFSAFLKTFPALKEHPYVSDVAMLEWAWQESYLSPVNPAPSTDAQAFALQPHVRLLSSAWPVVDIWQFALEDGTAPNMAPQEYFSLTYRRENTVDVWRLEKPAFTFLKNLPKTDNNTDFDIQDFLIACFKGGIFQGVAS